MRSIVVVVLVLAGAIAFADGKKQLIGKWHPAQTDALTIEFNASGGYTSTMKGSAPIRGVYKWIDKDTIEMEAHVHDDDKPVRVKVAFDGDVLTMTPPAGKPDQFKRVK